MTFFFLLGAINYTSYNSGGIRPSIVLNNDIIVSRRDATVNNPFIIN